MSSREFWSFVLQVLKCKASIARKTTQVNYCLKVRVCLQGSRWETTDKWGSPLRWEHVKEIKLKWEIICTGGLPLLSSPSPQFPPLFFLFHTFSIPRARLSRSLEQASAIISLWSFTLWSFNVDVCTILKRKS